MQWIIEKDVYLQFKSIIMKAQVISSNAARMPYETKKIANVASATASIPEGYVSFETFAEVFDRKLREQYAKL